jgi:5S rRNA maturation endonuclease (ribonuclease M5)
MSDTDYPALTRDLCIRFWGKPTSETAKELRWGSGGSKSYSIEKRTWFDHESHQGGGTIDLVMRECSTDKAGALTWLEAEGLKDKRDPGHTDKPQRQEAPKPSNEPSEREQPPQGSPERDVETDHYDYTDRDGAFQYRVIRYEKRYADGSPVIDDKTGNPKKTFKQKSRDASGAITWGLNGRSPCLYRWPAVEQAAEQGDLLAICEGEKDVHTLEAMGLVATTNSGGAQNWRPEFNASFKAAHVVVLIDNDDAGRERGKVISEQLTGTAASVKVIDLARYWADAPPKSDVTDWVKAGGTKDALLDIIEGRTKPLPPVSRFGAQRMNQIANQPMVFDWLIKHLVERSGVLIVAGESQAGKSFFVLDMGMKVARGLEYAGRKTRSGAVIHMASEDGNGTKLRVEGYRKANGISPDMDIPYIVMDPHAKGAQGFSLMSDDSVDAFIVECLEWKRHYGTLELIIIDTVSAAAEGLDENSSAEVTKMLTRVNRIRDMTGATVCLVHHMNAAATRIRGSSALVANVANVIEVRPMMTIPKRKDDKPEIIKDSDGRPMRRAILTKNKNGLNDVKWTFVLQEVPVGIDQDGEQQTTCVCAKASRQREEPEERQRISPDQRLVYDALQAALEASGQDMPKGTIAGPQVKRCAPIGAFEAMVRKTMNFAAPEGEVEARNKELSTFIKRTTTDLINSGYMGRDNDAKVVWWTGKSSSPRPRYQEAERPQEQPGAGISEEVKQEIADTGVPF